MQRSKVYEMLGGALAALLFGLSYILSFAPSVAQAMSWGEQKVYYLKNPYTEENFFTLDAHERNELEQLGWEYQGVSWIAPKSSETPVWRLYNPNNDDHLYTKDFNEYISLPALGWEQESIKFYSDDEETLPIYRLYHPEKTNAGAHIYTTSQEEYEARTKEGWQQEGSKWFGLRLPTEEEDSGLLTTEQGWWDPVLLAMDYLGWPYVYAGESPSEGGFDCSGLTQYVYGRLGYELPRTTFQQISYLKQKGTWKTDIEDLKPGDIVVMDGGNHIGIYAGKHPESGRYMMVDAGASKHSVVYREIYSIYWTGTFMGGGSVR